MLTLASDFGSPYPAAMKGVVLRRCDADLVDVAHDLPRGDVRGSAFWLRFVLPEFPPAVHLAVVDPGVGTGRDALVVRAGEHVLVGPDNGLVVPAARALANTDAADGDDRSLPRGVDAFVVDHDDPASATFHGRDVFAPAAADAHAAVAGGGDEDAWDPSGLDSLAWLTPTDSPVDLRFPVPEETADGLVGEVLAVDGFGNVVTNVHGDVLEGHGSVTVDGDRVPVSAVTVDGDRVPVSAVTVDGDRVPVAETFADVDAGDRLVTVGSHGYLECDVNDGRGDEAFGLSVGDEVRFGFDADG
jgi:hypothetical protein